MSGGAGSEVLSPSTGCAVASVREREIEGGMEGEDCLILVEHYHGTQRKICYILAYGYLLLYQSLQPLNSVSCNLTICIMSSLTFTIVMYVRKYLT